MEKDVAIKEWCIEQALGRVNGGIAPIGDVIREAKKIGYMRCSAKAGETVALIHIRDLRVTSSSIKFLPWGKKKLLKKVGLC